MEKKNIVFIAKSLDGYIAGPNGELDWLELIPNPENKDLGFLSLMEEVDAIVMGRSTFDVVCNFDGDWPYSKPVFVLSNSLETIPENLADKATLLKGDLKEILGDIYHRGYGTLYIDGGRTIQNFLKEDLIDELRITTIPILLGSGFSLFGELKQSMEFVHLKSEVYLGQLVQNHYMRKIS